MDFKERYSRTALLLNDKQIEKIKEAHVMLFGLGGVGSYVAEGLARLGVGHLTIIDNDCVVQSNINRQLPALYSTIGMQKTAVVEARLKDIAPDMKITTIDAFYLPQTPVPIEEGCIVVDAIDTISAKIDIAVVCKNKNIPLVSCMGMGNRLDPTQITIGDLFETEKCPLCRVMRRELRKRNVDKLRVVYSKEQAISPTTKEGEKIVPGSISFVPSVAGLYLAYDVMKIIIG